MDEKMIVMSADDCMKMVGACCKMLQESVEYQRESEKRIFTLCENMMGRMDDMFRLSQEKSDKIESAVSKLADAALSLSKGHETTNQVVKHLEKTYTTRIDQALKTKDQLYDSYVGLLKEFEAQRRDLKETKEQLFDLMKGLVMKPTTNTNIHNK